MSLVSINNLVKSFGSTPVLKGISLDVEAESVISIIGRSGSGKSTLLRCINGLVGFDSGSIQVDGTFIGSGKKNLLLVRQRVGMIFQQFNLFPHLSAGENVMLALRVVKNIDVAEATEIARDMLATVGLPEKFDAFPNHLSGGQQQRVAIARALAMRPKVLLCDEITSSLDPELVGEVLSVIENLVNGGMTIILVTHEMQFARKVSDRIVFMHEGVVHEEGPPNELLSTPKTAELSQFIRSHQ